jgi:hypothetical protein
VTATPGGGNDFLARIVARANELLEARADALSITDDEPALAHAHREATSRRGAVKHARDHDELDGQVILPTRRKARIDGFDLDAEVTLGTDPPREVDFDFRILPGKGFELRLPATNGQVVVQVANGQLGTIRAQNGDFTCDLAAATCTNEAGEVVKL